MSRRDTERSGANSLPLGGGTGGGRFGGGGGTGASLLNPSYLNPGALVPHGSDFNERKRPAERESRFDQKESREERLVVFCRMLYICYVFYCLGKRKESPDGQMRQVKPTFPDYQQ